MRVLVSETTWITSAVAHDLEKEGFLLTRANDGEESLLFVRDAVQDAVVLDADLGDISTPRAIKSLRVFRPRLPVLVVADGAGHGQSHEFYIAGADHVATAQPEAIEFAARIRALARRLAGYTSPVIALGAVEIDLDARRVSVGDVTVSLTPAEYEFVEHLALKRRQIVSRDEIMAHLYGLEDAPDAKVLDVHSTRIRKKLASAGADPGSFKALNGRGFILDDMQVAASAA